MKKTLLLICFALFVCKIYSQTYEKDYASTATTHFNGEVNAIKIDGNGNLLIGGDFTTFAGETRAYFARLDLNLTLDAGFDPSADVSSSVGSLAIHSDNSVTIVTAGSLKRFDDSATEFAPGTFTPASVNNVINVVAAESTGHAVLIGGDFTDVGNRIARLIDDGTVDATFETNIGTGFNGMVRTIEITSGGKILVGGNFTTFNGITRHKIALLNSDGTLDTGFDPGTTLLSLSGVYAATMQADGRILVGSTGSGLTRVVRFNADGSEDSGFAGTITNIASSVRGIFTSGTDDIIVVGWFDQGIQKLDYTDGSLIDAAAGNGVEGSSKEVNTLAVQSDGSVVLGGDFTSYNGHFADNFVRATACHVSFDTPPVDASACEGDGVSFTVAGTGGSQFVWQVNTTGGIGMYSDIGGGIYSGEATATLNISAVTSGMDNYRYRCVIHDSDASVPQDCFRASDPAILTVNAVQTLTADPVDDDVCVGESASFSISITGPVGGFQWQEDPGTGVFADLTNGGKYLNVNQSFLSISDVTEEMDGYKYRLVSTLCQTGYTTLSATLNVSPRPVITEDGQQRPKVCVSGDASFSVDAAGDNLTYQWQYRPLGAPFGSFADLPDGGEVSNATTSTLNLTGVDNTFDKAYLTESDGSVYAMFRCKVTSNGCDAYTTETRILQIYPTPMITSQPISPAPLCDTGSGVGVSTSFSVQSTSGVPQWQVNDGNGYVDVVDDAIYSGSTSSVLNITGASSTLSGYTYRAIVGTCSPDVISDEATLTIYDRPIITQGLTTADICEGGDAEFTVVATGNNLTYQWQERIGATFVDIVNNSTYFASDGTLQISGADLSLNNRVYRCVVSSGESCTITTGSPQLRVNATPSISGGPANKTICDGTGPVTFSRSATNFNGSLNTYQWQEAFAGSDIFTDISDGTSFTGTTGTTLTVLNPTFSMDGNRYRLSVNGCVDEVVSDPATLTIETPSLITSSPETLTICKGGSTPISFSVAATGTNLTYTWEYSLNGNSSSFNTIHSGTHTGVFTGYNSSTLQIERTNLENSSLNTTGVYYRCRVSGDCNAAGTLISESAQLVINEVTITQEHPDETICEGSQVNLWANAAGESLTYQWQVNDGSGYTDLVEGNGYEFVDGNIMRITAAVEMNGNTYRCAVDGLCAGVTTGDILLTVNMAEKPTITPDLTNASAPVLEATAGADEYWWYFNDVYQTSTTSQTYSIIEEGKYEVRVLINDCLSELSDPYNYVIDATLGLGDNNEIQIYPNPVKDFLKTDADRALTIQVFGMDGKVNVNKVLKKNESLDLRNLKSGQYLIQILDEKNIVYSGKILKTN